ncbi:MAG: PilZ domain-containing protein [Deltaproteobacteria bacterium]|nr:PilZ domain-containing protein [Deltaproteobacteria bacterium]
MRILKLRVRNTEEFDGLYQGDLGSGGLFVPTTTSLDPGEVVVVELAAPNLPNKVMIRGEVKSWRPALPRLRVRAGAIVEFAGDEATKRDFIRDALSGRRVDVPRRKHNRLPVSLACHYRLAKTSSMIEGAISEISVGGAMLNTTTPIALDSDVILELIPPGAAAALSISAKVSYHVSTGGTGLKFVFRDGDGSRRLRELVRRLRAS